MQMLFSSFSSTKDNMSFKVPDKFYVFASSVAKISSTTSNKWTTTWTGKARQTHVEWEKSCAQIQSRLQNLLPACRRKCSLCAACTVGEIVFN